MRYDEKPLVGGKITKFFGQIYETALATLLSGRVLIANEGIIHEAFWGPTRFDLYTSIKQPFELFCHFHFVLFVNETMRLAGSAQGFSMLISDDEQSVLRRINA